MGKESLTSALSLIMTFQMTFAIITPASHLRRLCRPHEIFRTPVVSRRLVALVVYAPVAHWVWGGGFLRNGACSISPEVPWWKSIPASRA